MNLITTSWDDGYPADHRLAELLQKYNIQGTFYIPKSNAEYEVMNEKKILEIAQHFEVGGHTINHVKINKTSELFFGKEIMGCFQWLENLLEKKPVSFCFPCGVYNKPAIAYTLNTGFKIIRTTELLNPHNGYAPGVIPTTIQVYKHSNFTYFKHLLKRLKFQSLGMYVRSGCNSNLLHLVEYYLKHISQHGGCFHLWGHSWEIEENNLWKDLEQIFKLISNHKNFNYIQNQDLLN